LKNKNYILFAVLLLCLSSCYKRNEFGNFGGLTQGTTYNIVFERSEKINAIELKKSVEQILYDFDLSLSLYKDSSVISKVNRNEDVMLDTFFIDVFNKSRQIYDMTGGAFDITIGPLVKAWGFGPDALKSFSEVKRDSLMNLVGMDKVTVRDGRIVKANPAMYLDVNGIAQGYSVDVICRYFDNLGIRNYLVEIGGEVRGKGSRNGAPWKIGIDKPSDFNIFPGRDLQAIIKIKDRSVATSGNYRKFFVEDGIKYSHTIDPKTGYPVKNQLLSITIIASDCTSADGLATACMVMGKDKAMEFLKNHNGLGGFMIYSDEKGDYATWITENLKKDILENSVN
jgi:thiamine biosynthesis lipoprotein